MDQKIFRKKNMERISSPDQLNDYIHVTGPSVWIVLAAVIFLLLGLIIWGFAGQLDTTLTVAAVTENGQTVCYVRAAEREKVSPGMAVSLDTQTAAIARIAPQPIPADEHFPAYLVHVGGISPGEWVYEVVLDQPLGEDGGIYALQILVERISPMFFILN